MITLERPGLGESPNTTWPFGSFKKNSNNNNKIRAFYSFVFLFCFLEGQDEVGYGDVGEGGVSCFSFGREEQTPFTFTPSFVLQDRRKAFSNPPQKKLIMLFFN